MNVKSITGALILVALVVVGVFVADYISKKQAAA